MSRSIFQDFLDGIPETPNVDAIDAGREAGKTLAEIAAENGYEDSDEGLGLDHSTNPAASQMHVQARNELSALKTYMASQDASDYGPTLEGEWTFPEWFIASIMPGNMKGTIVGTDANPGEGMLIYEKEANTLYVDVDPIEYK